MAIPHLSSGEVASLLPLGDQLEQTPTTAFFKEDHLEVMRIVLSAGKRMPAHAVDGPITMQCIEGEVEVGMGDMRRIIRAGDLLYLAAGIAHELAAAKNSSLLLTVVLLNSSGMPGIASRRRQRHDDDLKT